ncbi:hypothetical protein ADL25_44685 [Streptomyces sp. NRRL F-5122]|uniref:hypothetical protein n=1 Tax=Streptomyces sp. NRRL F-5122 TaxID=1609098 RepID=UPI000740EE98|nr:hypothetical protein [Streptomyces sp. NRRL F-5122]KUJ33576.1 hypothetical protein ADL25_44685 [Streptomyces sp. NRRL F-5122]
MAGDPGLQAVLHGAGFTRTQWESLVGAVRDGGDPALLTELLDAVEEAAAAVGVDGITSTDRQFQPLPDVTAGVRTAHVWRCPHPRPCGRFEPGSTATPVCPLTQDPLTPVTVISG